MNRSSSTSNPSRNLSRRSWRRRAAQWLGGICALLLVSLPAFSQSSNGRIFGTITDQSGGVVAGTTVTVVDVDRGVNRTLTTDDAGEYNAPNLIPGNYTVRAESKGFKRLDRSNIVLQVGQEIRVDLTLQPGEQEQTVTVTEAAPLVETTNATLGGTLDNADINDMPLNGRNYQNLLSLRPGVTVQPGGGPWTQSANGVRPDESAWFVEGIINANFYDARPIANMPSPFTDGATILPIDAIQEFNLEENPKAEFGWKPGAVVNVGIKSGTNNLHGTAYAFGRSDAWAARNAFTPAPQNGVCLAIVQTACDKLPAQLKQFGGVVGGPIKRDKLFFMGGYEGLRSYVGNAIVTGGIPSDVAQAAPNPKLSMVDAINALQTAGVAISPVSLSLAGCKLTPTVACTGGLWPANTGSAKSYTSTFPNTNTSDNGVGKIDYHINDKNTLNGMVLIGRYQSLGEDHPFVNALFEDHAPISTYTASGNWDWTPNSRMVNEVRFGYNKVLFDFFPADAGTSADGTGLTGGSGYAINTGITSPGGLPNINLTGYEKLGTWHNRPFYFHTPYYDGQDNVSYLMGKHTFKFGAEIAHIEVDSASYDTGRGRVDFQGGQVAGLTDCGGASCPLEDFFAGAPSRGFVLTGNAARVSNWMSYAGFAQDDWRVTSKVILNLGLRYSYVSPVEEANGLFGTFIPNVGMQDQSQTGGSLWKPDHKDFSPRLGFAWDLTGKGTTVVRGGFNMMYSVLTIATLLQEGGLQNSTALSVAAVPSGACTVNVTPPAPCPSTYGGNNTLAVTKLSPASLNWDPATSAIPTLNGGKVFPSGVTPSCTATAPCNIMAVDPNLTTPYVEAWNFGVTHAFNNNLSLEVEYVGSHGARLTGFRDLNQPNGQGVQPLASMTDKFGNPMSYLGYVDQLSNDGRSNYNGLQTTLTQRLSHGFSFVAGYSYSHALDNGSLNRQGFLPQQSLLPGLDYSSGDFDIRHRFTFTTSYDLPAIHGHAQMLEGWKLNAIITLQSGQPWAVWDTTNNFDTTGSGDNNYRWDFFGNPADFKSQGANSIPYCLSGVCTVTSGVTGQASAPLANSTAMWNLCVADANGTTGLGGTSNLASLGCFVSPNGKSVMTPPATGTFGNMGRNIFRDTGFRNVDFSVFKNFTFKERYSAQFRVEFFNIFNHPNYANPYGSVAGYGVGNDPGGQQPTFGCGCATPDVMAGNPLVGSGSARTMQLGLKLGF